MEKNVLKINTEFGTIICEKYDNGINETLSVYLADEKDGVILQDIVNIEQKYDPQTETRDQAIDVCVWSDKNSEDYTHRFTVHPYMFQNPEANT